MNQNLDNDNQNNAKTKICQCGQVIEEDWKFCPNCKEKINRTDYSHIYIIVFVFTILLGIYLFILDKAWIFILAIPLIIIVTAKVKYQENKSIQVLFWITMILLCCLAFKMLSWSIKFGEELGTEFGNDCYDTCTSCPG